MISHQCDFAGCTNPTHMRMGTNATNRIDSSRGEEISPIHSPTYEALPKGVCVVQLRIDGTVPERLADDLFAVGRAWPGPQGVTG